MAKSKGTELDGRLTRRAYAQVEEPEKYPLLVRVYGALGIVACVLQIVAFVQATLDVFVGKIDLSVLDGHTTTTIVVGALAIALSVVLAVMFAVLGVRLLRGQRHRAVLLCDIMIALEALVLIFHLMLTGVSLDLVAPGVNMVILIILQTYSDPALRGERKLQRHLHELEWKSAAEEGTLGRDPTGKGYISLNFFNLFWIFVIASIAGYYLETIYRLIYTGALEDRAGLLYGPFSPIYGVGAVCMTAALNRMRHKNPVLIFIIAALIGGAVEYFFSWAMEVAFGITAWEYKSIGNINGRTSILFMIGWGVLGLLWVRYATPFLLKLVNKIPWNWRYALTTVCTALMLADCVLTLAALDCWYQRNAGTMDFEHQSAIEAFCNEFYDDEFMENRFQSMTLDPDKAARSSSSSDSSSDSDSGSGSDSDSSSDSDSGSGSDSDSSSGSDSS